MDARQRRSHALVGGSEEPTGAVRAICQVQTKSLDQQRIGDLLHQRYAVSGDALPDFKQVILGCSGKFVKRFDQPRGSWSHAAFRFSISARDSPGRE